MAELAEIEKALAAWHRMDGQFSVEQEHPGDRFVRLSYNKRYTLEALITTAPFGVVGLEINGVDYGAAISTWLLVDPCSRLPEGPASALRHALRLLSNSNDARTAATAFNIVLLWFLKCEQAEKMCDA
ncbi:hypothetical protein Gbth_003_059 [Gluconobacter thailandicus F149-1 = NBRC 100600]|uniref:Uncharacterized protein n=1 Tax=Gluconobacter thailandicus NBRC 3257 TaxID=1381097 RepID=A0ABQ0IZK7_GLUTH|nr:hypothetical protein [Gluconobacter thailandicus]KXV53561.1 hypothetical protein AD946_07460 [Gluconobacter thailandicus]GAC88464.1 hypothetical protein NBRC3255_2125 [Gluconobacter thailandicus NBRC 3255]GAD27642.1 hypothetical protein NBRC3257_2641 [Gluconobacter thailandicus NBRC 3257]GAN91985.1 hypothetical protein Gbth_003_059 [Gluconobacter thailandicus F149-1 = NBRC 100600]GBR61686.1 hypothetical protein AA100600_3017 [Gluconobacter thailandicus F149-1 = NBRC 100600]